MSNKELKLTTSEFAELIVEISEHSVWSDFCHNQYTYTEYIAMSTDERKNAFDNFIKESDVKDLLDEDYWEGVFKNKPTIDNDLVIGIEE